MVKFKKLAAILLILVMCFSILPTMTLAVEDENGVVTGTELSDFDDDTDYSFFDQEYEKQVEEDEAEPEINIDESLIVENPSINVAYNFLNNNKEITSTTSFEAPRDLDDEGLKVLVNAFPEQVYIDTNKTKVLINDTFDITDQCGYDSETGYLLIPYDYYRSKIDIQFNLNEDSIVDVTVQNVITVTDPYGQDDVRTESYTCKINSNELRFPLEETEYFEMTLAGDQGYIDIDNKLRIEGQEIIANTSPMGGNLRTHAHTDYIGKSPIMTMSTEGNGNALVPDNYPTTCTVSKSGSYDYGSYGSHNTGHYSASVPGYGTFTAYCAQPSAGSPASGAHDIAGFLCAMNDNNPENVSDFTGWTYGALTPNIINRLMYYYGQNATGQQYVAVHIALGLLWGNGAGTPDDKGANSAGISAANAMIQDCINKPDPPENFQSFLFNVGDSKQSCISFVLGVPAPEFKKPGYGKIKKVSANPEMTEGSSCYSLAGAVFEIYKKEDNSLIDTLTTEADGTTPTIELDEGTYYAKEITAPKGFKITDEAANGIEFNIVQDETTEVEVKDEPLNDPVSIFIRKGDKDKDGNPTNPQGGASLEGAQFTVKYYNEILTEAEVVGKTPTRTWVLKTLPLQIGDITLYEASLKPENKIGGDDFFMQEIDGVVVPVIPLGTITIQETKPPEGYLVDSTIRHFIIQPDITDPSVVSELNVPLMVDEVIRGGVKIEKHDIELDKKDAQGDGDIRVATFEIVNNNKNSVEVNKVEYAPNEVVYTAQTVDGVFETANDLLPYGDYIIREKTPPLGYLNTGEISRNFSIENNHEIVEVKDPIKNNPIRAGVFIQKWDNETNEHTPQGGATFANTEIEIVNKSAKPVLVEGKSYNPDQVVYSATLDENGEHQTKADLLPYGTYLVREKTAPDGYLHTGNIQYTFTVREANAGKIIDPTKGEGNVAADTAIKNEPKRGDIEGIKIGKNNQERLAGVPFTITSLTTGESHTLVTDRNGQFSTHRNWNPHTQNTNRGETDEDGIWFGDPATVDDTKGALLYDKYRLEEQRCAGNEGYELIAFDFDVYKHNTTLNLGTLEDYKPDEENPEIGTTAADIDTGNNNGIKSPTTTIVDTVYYYDLTIGTEYTVKGTLMVKDETGEDGEALVDADGNEITAEKTFTPSRKDGTVELSFTFDTALLDNDETVVFEELEQDGKQIAVHADITDNNQTVKYSQPQIQTTATGINGEKVLEPNTNTTIIDKVEFSGLTPKKDYEIRGVLMDKATNAPVLVNGQAVEVAQRFTPTTEEGFVEIKFNLNSQDLQGVDIVVFEDLYLAGSKITDHRDIEDEGQTVKIKPIEIHTNAHAPSSDSKDIEVNQNAQIVDTVSYEGLTPGTEYIMHGTLIDKETGNPLVIDGKEVEISQKFIPETADGTVDLTFTVDTRELQDKELVVFEELTLLGKVIGEHKDPTDKDQTVKVKKINIHTNAHQPNSDSKSIPKYTESQIVDTVTYENLVPGTEYVLTGTLMDKTTGESLDITSQVTFVPDNANGTIDMTFTFDATQLNTNQIVVFEKLSENGKEVAKHEDINDVDQTVELAPIEIHTNAHAEGSDSKEILRSVNSKIVDTVSYTNLIPGKEYVMAGVLMDKNTGNALDVKTETKFTPQEPNGTMDMVFEFDGTKIETNSIVVYEELLDNGVKVAEHKDINDLAQTVSLTNTPPGAKTGADGLPFWLLIIGGCGAAAAVILYLLKKKAII